MTVYDENLAALKKMTIGDHAIVTEQCASCGCNEKHHDIEAEHCNVCWEWCIYKPAFVPKRV